MDLLRSAEEGPVPSKPLTEAISAQNSPRFEHMTEYKTTQDDTDLARFGKRPQLNRNFGLWSIIGLTCTLMITWEGILSVLKAGLMNGGPAGLIYGYLLTWLGNICQVLVMAELASM